MRLWIDQHIHVEGRPDVIFIKLYAHGAQDDTMESFFKQGELDNLFTMLETFCNGNTNYKLHYTSSREMYNVVKGLEATPDADPASLLDYELVLQS